MDKEDGCCENAQSDKTACMHKPWTQRKKDTPRNRYRELLCTIMDAKQHLQKTKAGNKLQNERRSGTISATKTQKKCFRRVVSFRFSLSFFIFHFSFFIFWVVAFFTVPFSCSSSIRLRENVNLVFHLRLTYMHRGRMPRICFSRLRSAGQLGLC